MGITEQAANSGAVATASSRLRRFGSGRGWLSMGFMKLEIDVRWAMVQARKDMTGEQVRLARVRIAREDESLDPNLAIGVQLCENLIRIANNCRATT